MEESHKNGAFYDGMEASRIDNSMLWHRIQGMFYTGCSTVLQDGTEVSPRLELAVGTWSASPTSLHEDRVDSVDNPEDTRLNDIASFSNK